jgi:hypothetical protein
MTVNFCKKQLTAGLFSAFLISNQIFFANSAFGKLTSPKVSRGLSIPSGTTSLSFLSSVSNYCSRCLLAPYNLTFASFYACTRTVKAEVIDYARTTYSPDFKRHLVTVGAAYDVSSQVPIAGPFTITGRSRTLSCPSSTAEKDALANEAFIDAMSKLSCSPGTSPTDLTSLGGTIDQVGDECAFSWVMRFKCYDPVEACEILNASVYTDGGPVQ